MALLELGFVYFIQHFGWLESLDIVTQVGVIIVIASPLVIAVLVLFGKQLKLSSVMIAVALCCVFMTFSMAPIWDWRKARQIPQRLSALGVELVDEYMLWILSMRFRIV